MTHTVPLFFRLMKPGTFFVRNIIRDATDYFSKYIDGRLTYTTTTTGLQLNTIKCNVPYDELPDRISDMIEYVLNSRYPKKANSELTDNIREFLKANTEHITSVNIGYGVELNTLSVVLDKVDENVVMNPAFNTWLVLHKCEEGYVYYIYFYNYLKECRSTGN